MTPRISVALCTHNGGRFIEQQLRSILAQSRRPDEVILSDDASSDDTVAIARAVLEAGGVAFRVLENAPALGVTANFEQAVLATSGELIALSDQDDVWMPDRLATMAREFDRPGLLLLFTDATLVDESGVPLPHSLFDSLELRPATLAAIRSGDAFGTLLRRNVVTGATVLFRRELLDTAVPFERGWLHDEWLAILAAAREGIDWNAGRLIDYRQHGSNQVGVAKPTLGYKITQVLAPRGRRTEGLAARSLALAQRLRDHGLAGAELAEEKHRLEAARAALPAGRLARVLPILRAARGGAYGRYASRGPADMLRDLLQGA